MRLMHRIALTLAALLAALASTVPLRAADLWQPVGPFGGPMAALAVDPAHPATVLAGTVNAGAFRSMDRGATWRPVAALREGTVTVLVFDPQGNAYAGAGSRLLESGDGGASWAPADDGLPIGAGIAAVAADARRPALLYASTRLSQGVFRSSDGGAHWVSAGPAFRGDAIVEELAVDPVTSAVYAGTDSGFWRSTDRGATWTRSGLAGLSIGVIAQAPGAPAVLYAGGPGGLFRSTDRGAHWRSIRRGLPGTIADIAVHPSNPSVLYVALPEEGALEKGGLFRSVDGGAHWERLRQGLPVSGVLAVALDPAAPARIWAGLQEDGVFRSADSGRSFREANGGLRALEVRRIALDPARPAILWAGPTARGLFRSTDGGRTWVPVLGPLSRAWTVGLAIDPLHPATVYASSGEVVRSDDGGRHWRLLGDGVAPPGAVGPVAVDPQHPSTVYAGGVLDVFRSDDRGATWAPSATGVGCILPEDVLVSPARPTDVYTRGASATSGCEETGGAFKSVDGGRSWMPIETALALDPTDPEVVYGVTVDGVEKSTDGGLTFAPAGAPGSSPPRVFSLLVDPRHPATLWAGTVADGVFVSADGGATWAPLGRGLRGVAVLALALDPRGAGRLWAATARGVFTLPL
jgi:photosystem II stability/assembly factor-like uncharacterized protein